MERQRTYTTREERRERRAFLEAQGQSCDANGGKTCLQAAVFVYTLLRRDPATGETSGEPVTKQSCSWIKHILPFRDNAAWHVLDITDLREGDDAADAEDAA